MRVLVTGGTGLVGSNVIRQAQARADVEAIASLYSRSAPAAWDCATVEMDLEQEPSVRAAVDAARPGAVIHCAAPRDEDRLERDHEWGWSVMVDGTRSLAEACRDRGARLVFVSSDWVFGRGGAPPYSEDTPPCPANYFGFLKAVGEAIVRSACPNSAVVRTAGVYGVNWCDPCHTPAEEPLGLGWLANYYARRLGQGLPIAVWGAYVNVWANPTLASDLADLLLQLALGAGEGVFHCCGRDSASRLELAQAVADAFGYDRRMVRAATPNEMDPRLLEGKLPAPLDSRLQCRTTELRLRRRFLTLAEGLAEFRRQSLPN